MEKKMKIHALKPTRREILRMGVSSVAAATFNLASLAIPPKLYWPQGNDWESVPLASRARGLPILPIDIRAVAPSNLLHLEQDRAMNF